MAETMYTLKQQPQDFMVTEVPAINIKDQGKYLYVQVRKQQKNTLEVAQHLAHRLGLSEKDIGFAGAKDKHAITQQVFSIRNISKEQLERIHIDKVQLAFLGYGDVPITLGALQGNQFEIIIRNLDQFTIHPLTLISHHIPNYFDEQRFSGNNVAIGRALVKKDFSSAVALITQPNVQSHLKRLSHDYIGALQLLEPRLLRMFVNAFQSYLWNETVARYLRKHGKITKEIPYSQGTLVLVEKPLVDLEIPLVGFGSEQIESPEIQVIIQELLQAENLQHRDFIIKQFPALTLEGEMRKVFIEIKSLQIGSVEDDELNLGKKKVKVSFSLGKGSYATMAIRCLIFE